MCHVHALSARADDGPLLGRYQFRNRALWLCLAGVLAVQVAVVHLPWARTVFGTVPLTVTQWALCLGTASTVLLAELVLRALRPAPRGSGRAGGPLDVSGPTGVPPRP
ncbi:cation-translocating P-type ATPase C-terminal domain-containing protein [Streptomyces sp. NPDC050704]|uniref:cation-translocating P-type ATPase C-terminal domain-containing protein n=1 Tax=Streptomyces sp. NPDC050704 TaxID=3157219 RepID=UPI0034425585